MFSRKVSPQNSQGRAESTSADRQKSFRLICRLQKIVFHPWGEIAGRFGGRIATQLSCLRLFVRRDSWSHLSGHNQTRKSGDARNSVWRGRISSKSRDYLRFFAQQCVESVGRGRKGAHLAIRLSFSILFLARFVIAMISRPKSKNNEA